MIKARTSSFKNFCRLSLCAPKLGIISVKITNAFKAAVNNSIKETHFSTLCFLPLFSSCIFDHDSLHQLFPGCKTRLFLLFQYPHLSFFSECIVDRKKTLSFFFWSNGQLSEIVCVVKCVLNCSFTCFRPRNWVECTLCTFSSCQSKRFFGISAPWPEELTCNNC